VSFERLKDELLTEKIIDRIEGRLDAEEAVAFDAEVAENESLAREYRIVDELLQSLRDLDADTEPSADFHKNLMAELSLEINQTEGKLVGQMRNEDERITDASDIAREDSAVQSANDITGVESKPGNKKRKKGPALIMDLFKRRAPVFIGVAAVCVLAIALSSGVWSSPNYSYNASGKAILPAAPAPASAPAATSARAAGAGPNMGLGAYSDAGMSVAPSAPMMNMSKSGMDYSVAADAAQSWSGAAGGSSAGGGIVTEATMAMAPVAAQAEAQASGGSGGQTGQSPGGHSGQTSQLSGDEGSPIEQKIIRNGNIRLEVDKFDDTIIAIKALVSSLGGYIINEYSYVHDFPERKSGNITIKIPFDKYEELARQTGAFGKVLESQVWSEDVTAQYIDLAARINVYETKYARLLALLEKSGELDTILAVENELATTNAELESLKGQMRYLLSRTDYSTLDINIIEKRIEKTEIRLTGFAGFTQRVKESFYYGINSLIRGLGENVIWMAGNIVSFLITIIIIWLCWIFLLRKLWRRMRGRKRPAE